MKDDSENINSDSLLEKAKRDAKHLVENDTLNLLFEFARVETYRKWLNSKTAEEREGLFQEADGLYTFKLLIKNVANGAKDNDLRIQLGGRKNG